MKVGDYGVSRRRTVIHLQEKGGVINRVPVHHKLREYLDEYMEAAKLAKAPESWLWRSMPGRKDALSEKPMSRHDALQVAKRRCATANLPVDICCHSFRGSGITPDLENRRPRRSGRYRNSFGLRPRLHPGGDFAGIRWGLPGFAFVLRPDQKTTPGGAAGVF